MRAERSCSRCGLVRRGARSVRCGDPACDGTLGPRLRSSADGGATEPSPGRFAALLDWQRATWTAPVAVVLGLLLARWTRWLLSES